MPLQVAVHLLVAGLLVLAVLRAALAGDGRTVAITVTAVAVGVGYGIGPATRRVRATVAAAALWLGAVLAMWLVLLALTPDAIWLAFCWFFLLLHLLPWRAGLIAVALVTAAAIGGFAWHQGTLTVGTALGPVLGALVAVVTVWSYTSIATENDRRRTLIGELHRTRAELAVAERSAGAMAERERLAREIHDTLAQGLSSIQLLLRAAGRTLPADGPADADVVRIARRHVEQAREAAQDNLAEARRFVAELAPPGLQGRSLPAALDRLCCTTSERSGVPVRFEVQAATGGSDGDGDPADGRAVLPTPVEVALLRVAQSAVANVTAHADAHRAAVTLTLMDAAVTLDVVDDGRGFDPSALPDRSPESGGFGLAAMRSRVTELGGTLAVESAPGKGTAIAVTIPLPRADP